MERWTEEAEKADFCKTKQGRKAEPVTKTWDIFNPPFLCSLLKLAVTFHTSIPLWHIALNYEENGKTDQHEPRRHLHCHHRHQPSSSRVRCPSVVLSLCSVPLCVYRTILPIMTPITKKSRQNARTRVLRPSSFTAVIAMLEEWGAAAEVTLLFRSPSSSCDEGEKHQRESSDFLICFRKKNLKDSYNLEITAMMDATKIQKMEGQRCLKKIPSCFSNNRNISTKIHN